MPERLRVSLSVDALGPRLTGIGRYVHELVRGLPFDPRIGAIDYFRGGEWLRNTDRLVSNEVDQRQRQSRAMRSMHMLARKIRPAQIVHAPNYFLPSWVNPGTGVATIHDLSVFRYPETHPPDRVAAFEKHFTDTIERAALVLTDSEWNRRELIAFAGLPEAKVRAVPLGVRSDYRPRSTAELAETLARLDLKPGGYGLCVSTLEPRKRIDRLLASWRILPSGLRARYPLVIAGASGWRNTALMEAIEIGGREGWVRFPGFVSEADLPALYSGARVFAYPSRYEGFGLPPLEAMASGIPTIVAPDTCVAELTFGGARLVDVEDVERLSEAIRVFLEDEADRQTAIDEGLRIAATYTWEACIERTVDAYLQVSGRPLA
jgi:glycosyltransferase involved in cell wall biosynthesis